MKKLLRKINEIESKEFSKKVCYFCIVMIVYILIGLILSNI